MAGVLIVVPGEPIAQGRPKFSTRNGVFRAYDPPDSRDYKEYVKMLAIWWGETQWRSFESSVRYITVYQPHG